MAFGVRIFFNLKGVLSKACFVHIVILCKRRITQRRTLLDEPKSQHLCSVSCCGGAVKFSRCLGRYYAAFSFMFAAPILYVIHALLSGLSLYIAASIEWMAGFGFSAGLVDMVLSSQNPLAKQWYMLLVQGLAFFAIYYFVFLALIKGLNLKTPGREDDKMNGSTASASEDSRKLVAQYVIALGGRDNLVVIETCITRLRLTLKDPV